MRSVVVTANFLQIQALSWNFSRGGVIETESEVAEGTTRLGSAWIPLEGKWSQLRRERLANLRLFALPGVWVE